MRTSICAASNAGVDELLSRLVKNGVFSLTFASVHGDDEERESPAYFEQALKALATQLAAGKVALSSLFRQIAIRSPCDGGLAIDFD
jgi:hypothetical protein